MRRLISIFASILFFTACSDGSDAPPVDGGTTLPDGAVVDTGAPDVDSGTPDVDSGTPDVDSGTPDVDSGSGCGTCPSGMTCGSANGIAVCRSATGIPQFKHVVVIVMENTSLATLSGSVHTPFINSLVANYASSTNYHGVAHPSLPNYIAMTSGMDVTGIDCDCQPTGAACTFLNCSTVSGACGCPQSGMHLGDQLEAAGLTWTNYAEDMGTPCNATAAGEYAPKHVPFLYYPNVQTDGARCGSHVIDYTGFAIDLAGTPSTYALIAPNLIHDMHGDLLTPSATNLANGDMWLSTEVPPILASSVYTDGGLLVIVWDEDDNSGIPVPDAPIPMLLLSPYANAGGFTSAVHADHASLLATIEDGLGLARLGSAAGASPLADFFPAL